MAEQAEDDEEYEDDFVDAEPLPEKQSNLVKPAIKKIVNKATSSVENLHLPQI